jgi:hypothetical protein
MGCDSFVGCAAAAATLLHANSHTMTGNVTPVDIKQLNHMISSLDRCITGIGINV